MTASEAIEAAEEMVNGERQDDYGTPKEHTDRVVAIWSQILGVQITARQFCWMMIGLKMARDISLPKDDNMVDTIGYVLVNQMVESEYDENG